MKILKLLNRKYLSIIIIFLFVGSACYSEDQPVDIWNIDKKEAEQSSGNNIINSENEINNSINESDIFNMQSQKKNNSVQVNQVIDSNQVKIIGLNDPEDYDLKIDMWLNSNGDQLKYLFSNLAKIDLSPDASELMNILILTNAYHPNKNITEKEFLKIKSDWLIKNKDLKIIEEYLIKNQIINLHPNLTRYFIDQHLSNSNIAKACEIFNKNTKPVLDDYLSKFNLYCLVNEGKIEEAKLIFDLKKELGFKDKYFEKKLNFFFGYEEKINLDISEKSILDFHLAHRTNPDFNFEPKENTNKLIWKYLAATNLLYKIEDIEITEMDKISLIEKAVNDENYPEEDLFELYKRFQFNINQLLNVLDSYKTLQSVEARALIYQKILLESEVSKKLELIKILKELFIKDNFPNSFDEHLKELLEDLNQDEIPSNYTSFYYFYTQDNKEMNAKIKFNNEILHQSKIVNYFNGDYAKSKVEKDIEVSLKKIKKNKKYILSRKDIILIESLRSDGIKISKKFDDLYQLDNNEMPTDIQVMINNNEMGATILRLIEVIGQDQLVDLDEDTLYFIISAFNQLDIDNIRNKILLKVLPLKV